MSDAQTSGIRGLGKGIASKIGRDILAAIVAYGVVLLLDWLLFRPSREVLETSPALTIHRPGGFFIVFAYYGGAVLSVLLIWWSIDKLLPARHWLGKLVTMLLVLSIFLGFASHVLVPRVGPSTGISGQAAEKLSCYLFVRPVDSSLCWLQTPVPLILDAQGNWKTKAWFSGPSGQEFEILVIGSQIPLHPVPFDRPGEYDCRTILEQEPRSALLVAHR